MTGKKSEEAHAQKRLEESAAPTGEPTNCDYCGKRLGVWFSLADKAYCSPCFHSQFWTPFQSVSDKTR